MTIHGTHPFADPDPDPVRRFRGRLGGAVALVTAGDAPLRAGLTVSSLLVVAGDPAGVVLLLDPDSDLHEVLLEAGEGGPAAAVVQLLSWRHRHLAEAFAGTGPAPGGPFRTGDFEQSAWGPRLVDAATWAGVRLQARTDVGWSSMLTCVVEEIVVGADDEPLGSRRGRWVRL